MPINFKIFQISCVDLKEIQTCLYSSLYCMNFIKLSIFSKIDKVAPLLRTREVPDSSLFQETGYPNTIFVV
jgi:hypothetical protein